MKKFISSVILTGLFTLMLSMSASFGLFTVERTLAATPTDTASQLALIQQLLTQIQSLQKLLLAMQSSGSGSTPAQTNTCLTINNNLGYRSTGADVSALQDFLQAKGYLSSEPTGFYGIMTTKALKSFQSQNGIEATGYMGSDTRAKIKALSCTTATPPVQTIPDPVPVSQATPQLYSAMYSFSQVSFTVTGSNFAAGSKLQYTDTHDSNKTGILTYVLSYAPNQITFSGNIAIANDETVYRVKIIDPQGHSSNEVNVSTVPAASADATPAISLSATPASITAGQSFNLTWSASTGVTGCTLSGTHGANDNGWWGKYYLGASGSMTIIPYSDSQSSYTAQYTMTCATPNYSANEVATVQVNPTTPVAPVVTTPTISRINPSSATIGNAITLYGTNLTSGGNPTIEFRLNGSLVGVEHFIDMSNISAQVLSFNFTGNVNATNGQLVPLQAGTYQVDVVTPNGTSNSVILVVGSAVPSGAVISY